MLSAITCSNLRKPDCEKAIGKCTWIPKRNPGCVDVRKLQSPKPTTTRSKAKANVTLYDGVDVLNGLSQLVDKNAKLHSAAKSSMTYFKIKTTLAEGELQIDSSKFGNKQYFKLSVTDTSLQYIFRDKVILLHLSFNGLISGSASMHINIASGQDILQLFENPNKTLWFQVYTHSSNIQDLHCSIKVSDFLAALLYARPEHVSVDVYNDALGVPMYIPSQLYTAIGALGTKIKANVGDAVISQVMDFSKYFIRR